MKSKAQEKVHVAVLMGGWSAERAVSLSSGKACVQALRHAGYKVTSIDVKRNVAAVLADLKPARRVQCAARPLGRGRDRPGNSRNPRDPLHTFGRARFGDRDAQGKIEKHLSQRRPAGRRKRARRYRNGGHQPSHGAALCGQACRGGIERRRSYRSRGRQWPGDDARQGTPPLWRQGHGRKVRARQGADLRGDGRGRARRDRDHSPRRLLRLRGQIRAGRLEPHSARAGALRYLSPGPAIFGGGACRPRLPGREPCRLSLQRHARRRERAHLARSQHPAGNDRNLARARARPARGTVPSNSWCRGWSRMHR